MDEFYNLPDDIKAKSILPDFVHDYGYSGKSPALPMCETLGIVNADDKQECQNLTQLVWPHGNQHFCGRIHSYSMLLAEIHEVLVKMLGESYEIEKEYIESHLRSTTYLMVSHKYEISNQVKTNLGLTGHTDKTFLSVLHQNDVNGLEIRLKDGEDDHWIFYQPSSYSSFIVIAGDVMMGWSNDRIKSCFHRVVMEVEEVRYSVGLFSRLKGLIQIPKELVDEKHPLKYKPFENEKYIDFNLSSNHSNKYDMNILEAYCGI
ncbi:2-oxoglutarate (2OG) and Fe(II)-dependent oxygenase superfamily protein [Euphorbia peplus]|nr:2-oxoglutarate (2OG) and Fe(II)-dependent oxygenase superfamily protein [Euphorbia peplus]